MTKQSKWNFFKTLALSLTLFTFIFAQSGCGMFRAKPKSSASVQQRQIPKGKRRYQKPPKSARRYFSWPIPARLTSHYGKRRGRFHQGIDIDGNTGDPIRAAASGRVVFSGRLGGYGKIVILKHPNGLFSAYAHNHKNLVKKGKKVKKGQIIARVGKTGRVTGSHLHFEIRDQRGTYDPLALLPSRRYSKR